MFREVYFDGPLDEPCLVCYFVEFVHKQQVFWVAEQHCFWVGGGGCLLWGTWDERAVSSEGEAKGHEDGDMEED